jgi:hypothetical protein
VGIGNNLTAFDQQLSSLGIQREYNIERMQHMFAVDAERYSYEAAQNLAHAAAKQQALMNVSALYGYGGLGGKRVEPVPLTLKEKRESRWRHKLVRMQDKLSERRMAKVSRTAWAVGWLWASILIFVATAYLIRWAMYLTFG